MNKTDALVAAIGAGVLVVALLGAALTGTDGGGRSFPVRWTTESAEHELDAQASGGGEVSFEYANPHRNTTRMTFVVSVTAAAPHVAPQADTVDVLVTGPDGATYEGSGAGPGAGGGTTTVEVEVPVAAVPDVATAQGASAAAAEASLAAYANETGVGNWTVQVSLGHGSPAPSAHTIGVTVQPEWYEPEVTDDSATVR